MGTPEILVIVVIIVILIVLYLVGKTFQRKTK